MSISSYSEIRVYVLFVLGGLLLGIVLDARLIGPLSHNVGEHAQAGTQRQTISESAFSAVGGGTSPRLVVSGQEYNFGAKVSGQLVRHTFILRNIGGQKLRLGKILPSCGCTSAVPSKSVIDPHGLALLQVAVNLSGERGYKRKTIAVYSNDPKNPVTVLTLEVNVISRIHLNPSAIDIRNMSKNVGMLRTVNVNIVSGSAIVVRQVKTSSKSIVADYDVVDPGKSYRVYIKVRPRVSNGSIHGWVHLITDQDGGNHVIDIPVNVMQNQTRSLAAH